MIKTEEIKQAVEFLLKEKQGCYFKPLKIDNGNNKWGIVIGWGAGFDEKEKTSFSDREYRICSKIAYNNSALQCDYDIDFVMPYDKETGINEDWYENNYKRYSGINGLLNKFIKEKCIAFEYLSVYDHSGITVSCGKSYGWDYSNVGFVYVAKDNPEVIAYRKTHSKKETEEWALGILHSEIKLLDDWCTGSVYYLVEEIFNTETEDWEFNVSLGSMYLNEYEDAISEIKNNFSTDCQLLNEKEFNKLFANKVLDTLNGQKLFEFMEIT